MSPDEPAPAKGPPARGRRPGGSGEEKAGLPAGMTPTVMAKQVVPRTVETEMRQSFLDYAMSVIVARALPDARDGLKPVHRRILYAMGELGMGPTSASQKCPRVV